MKNTPSLNKQTIEISKEEVNFWKSEIRSSMKRQKDEFISRIGYEELIRYFEALQYAEGHQINQMAIVDEFSPAIVSVITSTYYRDMSVSVTANNPTAEGFVKPALLYLIQHPEFQPYRLTDLLTASLKYGQKKVKMKNEMQLAAFDLLVAGFVAVEMNHASETGEDQTANTDIAPQEDKNPIVSKIEDGVKAAYEAVKGVFSKDQVEEKVAQEVENEKVDFTDKTYCKRWNPLDILFDSKAIVFEDSRFIGKVLRMSVAEFNVKFPKFKGKITPGSSLTSEITYQSHNNPEHKKSVCVYSIEIKKKSGRNCILVLADGIEEEIDYYEDPITTNGFKIKYKCLDKYGKIYPMSRAKKAKKPQDDINHYMTIQFEHVDRAMRKIAVFMQGLTPAGQTAQRSSDVYGIVEKQIPGPVYEAMPAPQVVPENKEIVMVMKEAINKTLQTSELAKSGKSNNDLLGQDQLEYQTFQTNVSSVQDALKDLGDELLDTLKDIQQQVWDGQDFFKVTGINGAEAWYDPSMGPLADIMVGDYGIETDITSAQRPDPIKDRQDALAYSAFMTSPATVQFAAMHGKRPTMKPLENVVKQFNQNPETAFEEMPQPMPVAPQDAALPGEEASMEDLQIPERI